MKKTGIAGVETRMATTAGQPPTLTTLLGIDWKILTGKNLCLVFF